MACSVFCAPSILGAQKYFSGHNEFGLSLGVSNYFGDFSQSFNLPHFKSAAGVYHKYNFSRFFTLRNQVSFLSIEGSSKDVKGLAYQNLSFKSKIYEFGSMVECNFHPFGTNTNDGKATPYLLLGVSAFWFNPYRLENDDINLRSIRTEQQKRSYSQLQPAIPIGLGIKTMINSKKNAGALILGFEAVFRKIFTDYLDDTKSEYGDFATMTRDQGIGAAEYGQAQVLENGPKMAKGTMRGDTHLKDWYYFIGLNLSYRLTPQVCR